MVKKITVYFFTSVILLFFLLNISKSQVNSFKELPIGLPPDNAGELIASKGGWKLIEFWHYSGGKWKATTESLSGIKELNINDEETDNGSWTDIDYLARKICENGFVLEYKIWHPQEVIDAIARNAVITPVLNIDKNIINCPENIELPISDFFIFEDTSYSLPSNISNKPQIIMENDYILIRVLPKLNCEEITYNQLVSFYPYKLPIVKTSFGSLSYAMYHHNGSKAGVGYSPDPAYSGQGIKTIDYKKIKDIKGLLQPGFLVTTKTQPDWVDEPSDDLRIGYNTFANAGAISIRFWYPIRVDYYAAYTDITPTPTLTITPTPTPTLTPSPSPVPTITPVFTENTDPQNVSDLDPDSLCIIRADERGNEQFDVDKGIPVRESLYVNIRTKEYLSEQTFTEHTYTESIPIRVKQTYNLTWREDHGHYENDYCGPGMMYHVKGTYCTDSDGDGINDACPGHPYYGCRDTDGDGSYDSCPGHSTWVSNWVDMSATEVVYSDAHMVTRNYSYWTVDHFEVYTAESATAFNASLPGEKTTLQASGIPKPVIVLIKKPNQADHVLNDPIADAVASNTIQYDTTANCHVIDLGTSHLDGGYSRPIPRRSLTIPHWLKMRFPNTGHVTIISASTERSSWTILSP